MIINLTFVTCSQMDREEYSVASILQVGYDRVSKFSSFWASEFCLTMIHLLKFHRAIRPKGIEFLNTNLHWIWIPIQIEIFSLLTGFVWDPNKSVIAVVIIKISNKYAPKTPLVRRFSASFQRLNQQWQQKKLTQKKMIMNWLPINFTPTLEKLF